MSGNASRSVEDLVDTSRVEERILQSRIEPEFTMQAVSNETGIPPETLRSWESRHGFPTPVRNHSNRRLYSERDIVSLMWLREQTSRGQGISEAIEMLRKMPDASPEPVQLPHQESRREPTTPVQQPLVPVQTLTEALLNGDLERAQSAWDHLAIATSPEGLCSDVLIPAHTRIIQDVIDVNIRARAIAFLIRKATILLDHSSPDRGSRDVIILSSDTKTTTVPAIALATILSRAGFRLLLPIMDAGDSGTVFALSTIEKSTPVILVTPGRDSAVLDGLRRLLRDMSCFGWWHDTSGLPTDNHWLPSPIFDVPGALLDPA
jgi:DNA-binding transcriptional MerR regulator